MLRESEGPSWGHTARRVLSQGPVAKGHLEPMPETFPGKVGVSEVRVGRTLRAPARGTQRFPRGWE